MFTTPCEDMLKKVLPLESHIARVRLLSPRNVPVHETSCVVHLAGEFFCKLERHKWNETMIFSRVSSDDRSFAM